MTKVDFLFTELEAMVGLTGPARNLRSSIEAILENAGTKPIKAAEMAESYEDRVAQRIHEEKRRCDAEGTFAVICISAANDRMVVGACCIEPGDPDEVQNAKRARVFTPELREALKHLDDNQFELFGAKIRVFRVFRGIFQMLGDQSLPQTLSGSRASAQRKGFSRSAPWPPASCPLQNPFKASLYGLLKETGCLPKQFQIPRESRKSQKFFTRSGHLRFPLRGA